jgi:hypothetical protein
MQALQAYTYLAFPTSSFADSSLQTALFDSEPRKNLIGESLLVDLRTKSLGRSWESEWEKKPSELVETYSKSSLDPDVNAGLYSENELTLGRLRDTLKDLSQRRSLREQVRTTSLNEKEKPVEPNEPNKENRESNPMIEQSIDILTAANTFLEAKLPKERIEAIEREIYNFLMERYGK